MDIEVELASCISLSARNKELRKSARRKTNQVLQGAAKKRMHRAVGKRLEAFSLGWVGKMGQGLGGGGGFIDFLPRAPVTRFSTTNSPWDVCKPPLGN